MRGLMLIWMVSSSSKSLQNFIAGQVARPWSVSNRYISFVFTEAERKQRRKRVCIEGLRGLCVCMHARHEIYCISYFWMGCPAEVALEQTQVARTDTVPELVLLMSCANSHCAVELFI